MSIVEDCRRRLWNLPDFFRAHGESIGLSWDAEFICFSAAEGEERVHWQQGQSMEDDPESFFQDLAEQVERYSGMHGSSPEALYLDVPEELAHSYMSRLPAMPPGELKEACYWELAHCLGEEGEGIEDYETGSLLMEPDERMKTDGEQSPVTEENEEGELCWLAALPKTLTAACRRAFAQAGLPAPYFVLKKQSADSFSDGLFIDGQPVKESWDYRRIGAAITLLTLLLLTFLTGFDLYRTVALSTRASVEEQKLAAYRQESKEMDIRERIQAQIQAKQQRLTKLSDGALPWYSVLVHFGAILPEGVALESLSLSQKEGLIVEGQAVSYDALAGFLQGLEKDDGFFRQKPVLEQSDLAGQDSGQLVHFRLSMGGKEKQHEQDQRDDL